MKVLSIIFLIFLACLLLAVLTHLLGLKLAIFIIVIPSVLGVLMVKALENIFK